MDTSATTTADPRIAVLEAALASSRDRIVQLEKERDILRASHEGLRLELELLKRRMFVAKADRVDTTQLELEFAEKLAVLDAIAHTMGMPSPEPSETTSDGKPGPRRPTGRRDLRTLSIAECRVEIANPLFDQLVKEGKAERIGHEESCKLTWQRGGMRRLRNMPFKGSSNRVSIPST